MCRLFQVKVYLTKAPTAFLNYLDKTEGNFLIVIKFFLKHKGFLQSFSDHYFDHLFNFYFIFTIWDISSVINLLIHFPIKKCLKIPYSLSCFVRDVYFHIWVSNWSLETFNKLYKVETFCWIDFALVFFFCLIF